MRNVRDEMLQASRKGKCGLFSDHMATSEAVERSDDVSKHRTAQVGEVAVMSQGLQAATKKEKLLTNPDGSVTEALVARG